MDGKERAVCGTLCLCLAIAVMSSVALVYLTVIVYVPSQRELSSGINDVPVMCTTTERKVINDDIVACRWSSCSEWCLSKGGAMCTHLYVRDGFESIIVGKSALLVCSPPAAEYALAFPCQFRQPTFPCWL